MIINLTSNSANHKYTIFCHFPQKIKQVSFRANNLSGDMIELSGQLKTKVTSKSDIEEFIQQQDLKLNLFVQNLSNLSRTELATEKYELCKWGSEIRQLEKLAKEKGLPEIQQLKLNYLLKKLNIIFQRESEIEKALKPFHPGDTVSDNSEIFDHHEVFGYNQFIREAIERRANNFNGLSEDEIKKVLLIEELVKKLDKEFEQLPPLEHDCIVYKGVSEHLDSFIKNYNKPFELMEKAKVGDIVIPDPAYTYTAFERSTAEQWGGEGGRHIGKNGEEYRIMMYEIHIPKGAKVSRNWEHRGEVLMPRNAQYKVKGKKVLNNGDIEVVLEYILQGNNKG